MRVATLARLLKTVDQQATVMFEVPTKNGVGGRRYHARDVVAPNPVASSDPGKQKVIIKGEG